MKAAQRHFSDAQRAHIEKFSKSRVTHGLKKHPLYRRWQGIKDRCLNKNAPGYKWYGGRGISVCEEWRDNFQAFYLWAITNGWEKSLQIDRIDTNGNYEPSNCRWVTSEVNQQNRTTTKLTPQLAREIFAATGTSSQIARDYGVCKATVYYIKRGMAWANATTA